MILLKNWCFIAEQRESKAKKIYYAIYLVTKNEDKIFIKFINKNEFDKLSK